MARAINAAKAFRALLGGGYICEKCNGYTDARTYEVMSKDETTKTGYRNVGHIAKSEFQALVSEGIIECIVTPGAEHDKKDKYGNVYHLYELAGPEKGGAE